MRTRYRLYRLEHGRIAAAALAVVVYLRRRRA